MPSVKLFARSGNNRPMTASVWVTRADFGDPAKIEEKARDDAAHAGWRYQGWNYDDHPLTIDLDSGAVAAEQAAGHADPEDSLIRTVVGVVSDDWKRRLAGGEAPETLRAELARIAAHLEAVAAAGLTPENGQQASAFPR